MKRVAGGVDRLHLPFLLLVVTSLGLGVWILREILHPEWLAYQERYVQRLALRSDEHGPAAGSIHFEIRQIRPGGDRVDRCTSCHLALEDPRFKGEPQPLTPHPGRLLEWHRPDTFGCTACHGGDGLATTTPGAAHQPLPHWPDSMVRTALLEARCGQCHVGPSVDGAPRLSRGRELIAASGCVACHDIPGFEEVAPPRVSLAATGAKVTAAWLRRWLSDPAQVISRPRMPTFRFQPRELDAIVAFLADQRGEPLALPPGVDPLKGDSERGALLVREGMCISCHAVNGKGGDVAADLGQIGSKVNATWLYRFLENPHAFNAETLMPHYRFEGKDLADVVSFLMTEYVSDEAAPPAEPAKERDPALIAEGRDLVEQKGCLGCHSMTGVERQPKIGPPLAGIGARDVKDLEFGDDVETPRTLSDWLYAKLERPEGFNASAKMPSFRLDGDSAAAVMMALLALVKEPALPGRIVGATPPPTYRPGGDFGRVWGRYRCGSCHQVKGSGGTVSHAPLDLEGSQVNPGWLFDFLKFPYTLRPIVPARMPRLRVSDEDARTLTGYLQSVFIDDRIPSEINPPLSDGEASRGAFLFDELGCAACHMSGKQGGYVGPVLDDVGARLRPGWLMAWIQHPTRFRPETIMPERGLSDADARSLAAFLSRKRTETKGGALREELRLAELRLGMSANVAAGAAADAASALAEWVTAKVAIPTHVELPAAGALGESIALGRFDLVCLDPLQYVGAHRAGGYQVVGRAVDPRTKAIVVTRADSPLRTEADFAGHRMAFARTSGGAIAIFARQREELLAKLTLAAHPNAEAAVMALLNGEAELAAVAPDTLDHLAADVAQKLKIALELKSDAGEPIAVRSDLPFPVVDRLRAGLAALADDAEGKKVLEKLGWTKVEPAKNEDYDDMRALVDRLTSAGVPLDEGSSWR
jgi:ABC-type phosphate/phosphonate transport system substrate-binding protein/cytochrome c2